MLIMTQDRISGLAAEKSPLKNFGPGNTQDDSNRNSWISSDGDDKIEVDCFGQVNGLFLGRYRADEVLLTYQGDELFTNKTDTGSVAVGYANGSSSLTLTSSAISFSALSGDYFYSSGTLVTITLNQTTDYVNVNDLITISGASNFTEFNGFHRVVRVQKDTSFTQLNSSGNSVFSQKQGEEGNTIQVIISTNVNDVPSVFSSSPPTLSIKSGISVPIIPGTAIVSDFDDVNFTYDIKFGISESSKLKSGDSPFTVNEYISFESLSVNSTTSIGTVLFDLAGSEYNSFYVKQADNISCTVFVRPTVFYAKDSVFISTSSSSRANLGSTFIYNGGAYQHRLGLQNLESSGASGGLEEFSNIDQVELNSPSISSISLSGNLINQLLLNGANQEFLHKITVKDRFVFSIRLPYLFKDGSGEKAFVFGSNDTIKLRKYVLDTADSLTTDLGVDTPIRKSSIATRTQNTVADFVQGKLIRVESNYIPLPREAFPTKITVQMKSTLNHNAANLFTQFLLEEVNAKDPTSTNSPQLITELSGITSNKKDISTFNYNNGGNGELVLNIASGSFDGKVFAGDHIYLNWPNNIGAYSGTVSKTAGIGTSGVTFRSTSTIHELYKGMAINSISSGIFINSIDKTANEFTTNISHGLSQGGTGTLYHSSTLAAEASTAWTGTHRVKSVTSTSLTLVVPNGGTSGDLTVLNVAGAKSASGAYVSLISGGKGRFVRPISSGLTKADVLLWNSSTTSSHIYTYNSVDYEIQPGTAYLIFSEPHGLVNNDKIVVYNLPSATNGSGLRNFGTSFLVTYSSATAVTIEIKSVKDAGITTVGRGDSSSNTSLLLITSTDHGFSVGDSVTLNNIANIGSNSYHGDHVIATVPGSKQFTVNVGSSTGYAVLDSSFNSATASNATAITGVHYLASTTSASGSSITPSTSGTQILNTPVARSVSIADAASSFENPIEVGNLIYRDAYQNSNGQYDSVTGGAKFTKTPNIDDATSTIPYRTDSGTAIQNTFIGTESSVVSQISLIRGDATTQNDIHLIKPFGVLNTPIVFTKLLQGLRVAILRAGISRNLPNPQIGVRSNRKDYSIRKELPTGAYYHLNRDSAKEFSGKLVSAPDNIDQLVDFGSEQLARPFPCLVISGNSGNIKKLRTRTALYGYFTALPQAIFNNKLNNLKEASFSIREVL